VHTQEQIEAIVTDLFRRISSDGKQSVGVVFADDGRYEGAYPGTPDSSAEENALVGAAAISKFFHEALPQALAPFDQWADTLYVVGDGDTAVVEGRSHGTATHDGSTYENRYAWIMHFRDGKIALMREYFNPIRYFAAIGPDFGKVIAQVMG
jgi:ketosteroid isomerase-like protein